MKTTRCRRWIACVACGENLDGDTDATGQAVRCPCGGIGGFPREDERENDSSFGREIESVRMEFLVFARRRIEYAVVDGGLILPHLTDSRLIQLFSPLFDDSLREKTPSQQEIESRLTDFAAQFDSMMQSIPPSKRIVTARRWWQEYQGATETASTARRYRLMERLFIWDMIILCGIVGLSQAGIIPPLIGIIAFIVYIAVSFGLMKLTSPGDRALPFGRDYDSSADAAST
jgi:hypothetical protein